CPQRSGEEVQQMRGQRVRYSTNHGKHNKQAQHAPPYVFERSKNVRGQETRFSRHSVSASVRGIFPRAKLARHVRDAVLASLKDRCTLRDKRCDALAEICCVTTGGNELGLVLHLGFQRLAGAIVEQGFRSSIGLRWSVRQLRGKTLDPSLELVIGEDLIHYAPFHGFTGTEHTVQERQLQSAFHPHEPREEKGRTTIRRG